MANLGNIGQNKPFWKKQWAPPTYVMYRVGGLLINIPFAFSGSIVSIYSSGLEIDKRLSSGGDVTFYDLQPGNYTAVSVLGAGTGTTWSVIVGPTSYTVTRITSATIPSVITQG